MDDLVAEFLTETNESLDELDVDLVNLEQNPNDQDLLSKIFRLVHTIKGTCGFIGLSRLEKVAHHGENVLGRFRDGDLEVTPEYVTLIFESIDVIKEIVKNIEETGSEGDGDDTPLIKKLDAAYEGKSTDGGDVSSEDSAAAADSATAEPTEPPETATDDDKTSLIDSQLAEAFGEPVKAEDTVVPDSPSEEVLQAKAEEKAKKEAAEAVKDAPKPVAQSLRVNVDVLENLMTMVSELVLTRNQLLQILRLDPESEFGAPLQRLNHVVSDLQEGVMKTRMQPIGNAWSKLPRIIRDLSLELNKKIDLEMRGQETELDRQVLELIKDPLTHMVRNSGDHGIEDPATRLAVGKPETGKILLNAFHEGGHIIIQISDDGKGLSANKIKAKALQNGLATEEELEGMSSQQLHQFIFKAGFSTAEKVTSVSGRGVGMDVVRTNIEKIGGSIELTSQEGKGSTFTIKIPLTLAIVSALIVAASGERFAIPQIAVRELVMASEHGESKIENIKGAPVFRLRDRLLPLVSLSTLLELRNIVSTSSSPDDLNEAIQKEAAVLAELEASISDVEDGAAVIGQQSESDDLASQSTKKAPPANTNHTGDNEDKNTYIVVTHVGSYEFGIIVDRVYDTEEIVVKPVSSILRYIDLFSGNTILGDGTVIMILDPNGIARATGEVEGNDASDSIDVSQAQDGFSSNDKTSLLLFRAGDAAPKAVPLSLVARLENIDLSLVEQSAGQHVVQYREKLMPILPFNNAMSFEYDGLKPVLVFTSEDNKSIGVIVDEIIDITEERIDVQIEGKTSGLLGSAIINSKATDVVDVAHFLQSVDQSWFKDHDDTPYKTSDSSGQRRILLIDDSPFFRNMLTPLLSVAGYEVTTLESPIEALQLCEKGMEFDVIISDIEMPDMDGFEFAEKIRSSSNWQDTPLVALSSHATPQDVSRGLEIGFTKYVAKFDRDTLLDTLSQTLSEQKTSAGGYQA